MYAVILTGGKQHKVQPGEVLTIEKLDMNIGTVVEFDQVLLVAQDNDIQIGTPYLQGVKVSAEIVEQGRGEKIDIIKSKRRAHHRKHMGHRQYLTKVLIKEIHKA